MRARNGFVSNSSSMSFIIPKKILTLEDYAILDIMLKEYDLRWGESMYESPSYFCGRVANYHPVIGLIKHYCDKEGVDCYED